VTEKAAESETSPPEAPGQRELSPASRLSYADLEQIVALWGQTGALSDPSRSTTFAFVQYCGQKYKVLAHASTTAAKRVYTLLTRTGGLFVACLGRVENCLVFEYVDASVEGGDPQVGKDIGNFLADLAGITAEPFDEVNFESWPRALVKERIILRRTGEALQRYLAKALVTPIKWDLEYLDALPKNFVYAGKGRLICVDAKHLYPGPQGVSLAKLYANTGQYCRAEDYAAIRSAYQNRVRDNRLDDPVYFEFLLLYYFLFFLVANAGHFSWRLNVQNRENRIRKKNLLRIIGASRWICFLEGIWWGAAFDLFWILKLPGRTVRFALRQAGPLVGLSR
jgi:hypothetical protein